MKEASKTKALFSTIENRILKGKGIDIGCGDDPIFDDVKKFDIEDGDANCITKFVHEKFDYVFSAHCLEHMHDPYKALNEWWQLVKENGFLYIVVPDEDLYEQGHFPSIFNKDHKNTFTIYKKQSWSKHSVNVIDLIKSIKNSKILKIELQDKNYDYTNKNNLQDQTLGNATAQICFALQKIPESNSVNLKSVFYYKYKFTLYRLLTSLTLGKIHLYFKEKKQKYKKLISIKSQLINKY